MSDTAAVASLSPQRSNACASSDEPSLKLKSIIKSMLVVRG